MKKILASFILIPFLSACNPGDSSSNDSFSTAKDPANLLSSTSLCDQTDSMFDDLDCVETNYLRLVDLMSSDPKSSLIVSWSPQSSDPQSALKKGRCAVSGEVTQRFVSDAESSTHTTVFAAEKCANKTIDSMTKVLDGVWISEKIIAPWSESRSLGLETAGRSSMVSENLDYELTHEGKPGSTRVIKSSTHDILTVMDKVRFDDLYSEIRSSHTGVITMDETGFRVSFETTEPNLEKRTPLLDGTYSSVTLSGSDKFTDKKGNILTARKSQEGTYISINGGGEQLILN